MKYHCGTEVMLGDEIMVGFRKHPDICKAHLATPRSRKEIRLE